jgi:hypothetical protein
LLGDMEDMRIKFAAKQLNNSNDTKSLNEPIGINDTQNQNDVAEILVLSGENVTAE